jgi:hypothetical protein
MGGGRKVDRQIRLAFWCAAVLFGALDAWNNRHVMNSDGISYLDLSDAYLQTGWKGAGQWILESSLSVADCDREDGSQTFGLLGIRHCSPRQFPVFRGGGRSVRVPVARTGGE